MIRLVHEECWWNNIRKVEETERNTDKISIHSNILIIPTPGYQLSAAVMVVYTVVIWAVRDWILQTIIYSLKSLSSQKFKVWCFELVLQDAALVRFPAGEEFSISVLHRCQPNIVSNLDRYWFIAVISVWKSSNDWYTGRANHTLPLNYLDDRSLLSENQ